MPASSARCSRRWRRSGTWIRGVPRRMRRSSAVPPCCSRVCRRRLPAPVARRFTVAAGNPGLATGGSGDVLSGILGAFLARDIETEVAAAVAAQALGRAADLAARRVTARAMRPMDVIAALPDLWREWDVLLRTGQHRGGAGAAAPAEAETGVRRRQLALLAMLAAVAPLSRATCARLAPGRSRRDRRLQHRPCGGVGHRPALRRRQHRGADQPAARAAVGGTVQSPGQYAAGARAPGAGRSDRPVALDGDGELLAQPAARTAAVDRRHACRATCARSRSTRPTRPVAFASTRAPGGSVSRADRRSPPHRARLPARSALQRCSRPSTPIRHSAPMLALCPARRARALHHLHLRGAIARQDRLVPRHVGIGTPVHPPRRCDAGATVVRAHR